MKLLFIILGTISLVLGVVGIVVPMLPTTPFLLLSATLYMHSSPKLYNWLLNHKQLGSYIRNYRENKVIPLRAKVISITMLWSTILFSVFTISMKYIWLQALLVAIAIGVTCHILSFKSKI